MTRYNDLTPFSIAFAAAFRGFMAENNVTGKDIAGKLGRNTGYVSERVNGKRALDTEDIDALAMLAGNGWDGGTLFLELARRTRDVPGVAPVTYLKPEEALEDMAEEVTAEDVVDISARRRPYAAHGSDEGGEIDPDIE